MSRTRIPIRQKACSARRLANVSTDAVIILLHIVGCTTNLSCKFITERNVHREQNRFRLASIFQTDIKRTGVVKLIDWFHRNSEQCYE